jgi:hypothetical protein
MMQTVKPLMLNVGNNVYVNANEISTLQSRKVSDANGIHSYFRATLKSGEQVELTEAQFNLLTDSSAQSSKLDIKG